MKSVLKEKDTKEYQKEKSRKKVKKTIDLEKKFWYITSALAKESK